MRLEEAIKKKEKYDAYDRAVIAERQKLFAKQEAERQLWEAYYQDPTLPPTPLEELAGWAGGHLDHHKEAVNHYFERIACARDEAKIAELIKNNPTALPQALLKLTIIENNERIQLVGNILGDYDLTFNFAGTIEGNYNPLAPIAKAFSFNLLVDTKGNLLVGHTWTSGLGASISLKQSQPVNIGSSLSIMPGGEIEDWMGSADNLGGSITGSKIGVGVDYVELITDVDKNERSSRLVITLKPGSNNAGVEGHATHSITSSWIMNTDEPFNIYDFINEKTEVVLQWLE